MAQKSASLSEKKVNAYSWDTGRFAVIIRPNEATTLTANPGEVTVLLRQWKSGDKHAESQLFEMLMPDLRRIAAHCFARERPGHTLQPTALVNEAFLRLAAARNVDWRDRGHFLALAARIMRRYLIDHWRGRPAVNLIPMDGIPERVLANHPQSWELASALDSLLDEMENESARWRTTVELKFFLGLTDEDAADALNIPLRTLQRDWHRARKWLFERLSAKPCTTTATKTTA